MDTTQFGGTFWISIAGMTLGFLATVGVYCLKAKCNQVVLCWGLIKVKRDVNAEVNEDNNAINHGMNPYQFQPITFTSNNDANNSTAIPTYPSKSILIPAPTTPPLPAPIHNV